MYGSPLWAQIFCLPRTAIRQRASNRNSENVEPSGSGTLREARRRRGWWGFNPVKPDGIAGGDGVQWRAFSLMSAAAGVASLTSRAWAFWESYRVSRATPGFA